MFWIITTSQSQQILQSFVWNFPTYEALLEIITTLNYMVVNAIMVIIILWDYLYSKILGFFLISYFLKLDHLKSVIKRAYFNYIGEERRNFACVTQTSELFQTFDGSRNLCFFVSRFSNFVRKLKTDLAKGSVILPLSIAIWSLMRKLTAVFNQI